jgi:hypothetical protein
MKCEGDRTFGLSIRQEIERPLKATGANLEDKKRLVRNDPFAVTGSLGTANADALPQANGDKKREADANNARQVSRGQTDLIDGIDSDTYRIPSRARQAKKDQSDEAGKRSGTVESEPGTSPLRNRGRTKKSLAPRS